MFRKLLSVSLLLSLVFIPFGIQADDDTPDQAALKKKISKLETISDNLSKTWKHLGGGETEIANLRDEARKAMISNAGVVMFKGLANTIQKFFDTPSPDGLLQDILSELLIDTNSKPRERTQFQVWNKRIIVRQKNLRKSYDLLERVLKEPLNRFDDDKAPFPYTKEIWKEGDGEQDPELELITRRLNVIFTVSNHLVTLIKKEREGIVEDRKAVKNEIKELKSMLKVHGPTGELVSNGNFKDGLEGWKTGGGGYSGNPQPQKAMGPEVNGGYVTMGAYGGTRNVSQIIKVPHCDLEFKARFRIIQWSTFDGGTLGGYVSVGIAFKDKNGGTLASTTYYLNPYAPNQSRPGSHWIELKPCKPFPTPWFDVKCDVAKEVKYHNIDPAAVDGIMVYGGVFGTHEDEVMTVATFGDFSLRGVEKKPEGETVKTEQK